MAHAHRETRPTYVPLPGTRRIPPVSEPVIRTVGVIVTLLYGTLIGWLYLSQPQTLSQVTGGLTAAVGAYRVDERAFADGLRFFHNEQFVESRLAFERADRAQRDAVTQF